MPPNPLSGGTYRRARLSFLGLLAVLVALVFGAVAVAASAPASAGDARLRVMTYNIRLDADAPPRDWASRLPLMKQVLRRQRPDLLGVQEATWPQMRDLDAALPGHDWIGMGRQGGTRDEFSAIFYRKDRFEVLDFDHFWLSDTPLVIGSATWGNTITRMVTWAKFRDRRTGRVFYHVNTHFDHQSQNARVKSAELVLQRVRGFEAGVPVVLTGDFNVAAGKSDPYTILTGDDAFADTWETAERRGPAYNTFGGWKPPVPGGDRIDWILSRGKVRTLWTEIDTYEKNGQYPSDHYPVVAHLIVG
ncbi:endonuclease [Actinomadura sp. NBRC 104425]|uniref:endonuclease/exonuclease/phosphatase family protein n=1 Tax=Actinomadura sp. NBRC 104425 TaxID=3032204 RepID=UPI0024A328A1|nr:endonuclease/exonuclease/phosphatase family protein [Actinomadura sp. NBRC 104425]GLZ10823.1 endonuclease [Actinomadura sp. NBRC 104425]